MTFSEFVQIVIDWMETNDNEAPITLTFLQTILWDVDHYFNNDRVNKSIQFYVSIDGEVQRAPPVAVYIELFYPP